MDFGKAQSFLQQAEKELLNRISDPKEDKSYDDMQRCLDLARDIHGIISRIPSNTASAASLSSTADKQGTSSRSTRAAYTPSEMDVSRRMPINLDADSLPCYFLSQEKLFKIGQSRGESADLYKKAMPINEVQYIFSIIASLLEVKKAISVTDVMKELDNRLPLYKVNLTLGVLMHMGYLVTQGRGKYAYSEGAERDTDMWMSTISRYPERRDLLEAIANQGRSDQIG